MSDNKFPCGKRAELNLFFDDHIADSHRLVYISTSDVFPSPFADKCKQFVNSFQVGLTNGAKYFTTITQQNDLEGEECNNGAAH